MFPAILLMVVCGFVAGQFPHLLGVTPVLGAVLCAACFLRPRQLFLIGLGGILVRDLLMGLSSFTLVRLTGMALVVTLVAALQVRPNVRSLFAGLLLSAPVFHLTLAVGNWLTGTCGSFPRTAQGLFQSVAMAVPYFQRAFLGDLFFTGLFQMAYAAAVYPMVSRMRPKLSH